MCVNCTNFSQVELFRFQLFLTRRRNIYFAQVEELLYKQLGQRCTSIYDPVQKSFCNPHSTSHCNIPPHLTMRRAACQAKHPFHS